MATWDELSTTLALLERQNPRPLTHWPQPGTRQRQPPPFRIGLAAWATATAEQLHQQFGADVKLTVGALRYPQRTPAASAGPGPPPPPQLNPDQVQVALDGALSIQSGRLAQHGLMITNLASRPLQINTSGSLIAQVVNPATGAVVGGYSGPVHATLMTYTAAPRATERIPLLVGTDSFVPELGYAIPPGQWGIEATLDPALGQAVRTPILPLTITS
jgi:hypothetical protein